MLVMCFDPARGYVLDFIHLQFNKIDRDCRRNLKGRSNQDDQFFAADRGYEASVSAQTGDLPGAGRARDVHFILAFHCVGTHDEKRQTQTSGERGSRDHFFFFFPLPPLPFLPFLPLGLFALRT
jgi:hypothetical protein